MIIARKSTGGVFTHSWRYTDLNQSKFTISSPKNGKSASPDREISQLTTGGMQTW